MNPEDKPAFPRPGSQWDANAFGQTDKRWADNQDGITIRQYYAAKAMQAIVSKDNISLGYKQVYELITEMSFIMADAMIAFEEKEGNECLD